MPETAVKEKLSIEELSALYDRIYDIADRLFKEYNPCNIHSKEGKSRCTCHLHSTYRVHLCCTNCKYISSTGCTVKCLGCKLFLCYTLWDKYPMLEKRLYKLVTIAYKHSLPATRYWFPKEKWLKRMEKKYNETIQS